MFERLRLLWLLSDNPIFSVKTPSTKNVSPEIEKRFCWSYFINNFNCQNQQLNNTLNARNINWQKHKSKILTIRNMDCQKHGLSKTWTVKNMDCQKHGLAKTWNGKTWTGKNMDWQKL
jgi:hypothetical protein